MSTVTESRETGTAGSLDRATMPTVAESRESGSVGSARASMSTVAESRKTGTVGRESSVFVRTVSRVVGGESNFYIAEKFSLPPLPTFRCCRGVCGPLLPLAFLCVCVCLFCLGCCGFPTTLKQQTLEPWSTPFETKRTWAGSGVGV